MRSLVFVVVLACGGSVFPEPPTDGGAKDAAADVSDGAPICQYGAPSALATDKACVDSTQCTFVRIAISCCQEVAYGVNAKYKDVIASDVASRTASCPGCGCLAQSKDETDKFGSTFEATCDQGKCTAHAK